MFNKSISKSTYCVLSKMKTETNVALQNLIPLFHNENTAVMIITDSTPPN